MKRPGWTRLSAPGNKCGGHWQHDSSDWRVRHCGHPTANWPYYAVDPEHPERSTMMHNGLGFQNLVTALEHVEAVLAGTAIATNERCGMATRRIFVPARAWGNK